MSFNLSGWGLRNRSIVIYLMIVAVVAGLLAFYRLGRNEDPSFVIKTMVVSAAWPGASMEDTLTQVTERLERQLEETPGLDFLRSSTIPGLTTIFVNLKQSIPGSDVQDTWYQVRNLVTDIRHTLPTGTLVLGDGEAAGSFWLNGRNDVIFRRLVVIDETLQVWHSSELRREPRQRLMRRRVHSFHQIRGLGRYGDDFMEHHAVRGGRGSRGERHR